MLNPYYKIKNNKLIYLNDLLQPEIKENIDLSVFKKFIEKYNNKLLTKQPLGLCEIEEIYFLYPYSLGYGYPKTNIVKYFQVAKTGDEKYCKLIFELVKDKILNIAKKYDAVLFVPRSVDRKCNVLDYLKNYLKQNGVKIIETKRIKPGNEIKNIKGIKEKFKVAFEKFDVEKPDITNGNILIIDDMVNTGASMCAIANKIRNKGFKGKIYGLSIVGSLTEEIISDI